MRIIYDTNILLQILRDGQSNTKLQNIFDLSDAEESICLVTLAEIRSLSIQFRWGANRRAKMEELLFRLAILDINVPEIIDKYVEIDCYSKGKHLTRASNFSAIKMGKNDLWIAATASVYECKLLTMDLDTSTTLSASFGHLRDEMYNLAGQTSVGLSFEQPVETLESIAVGTLNILEAIRFMGEPTKFYNAASSEVFGDTKGTAALESTPFSPRSPYAVAKATAFWEVANYREAYGLFACSGILFNHDSPLSACK